MRFVDYRSSRWFTLIRSFASAVGIAIKLATHLLFFASETSLISKYCLEELHFGLDSQKKLIACFLGNQRKLLQKVAPGISMRLGNTTAVVTMQHRSRDGRDAEITAGRIEKIVMDSREQAELNINDRNADAAGEDEDSEDVEEEEEEEEDPEDSEEEKEVWEQDPLNLGKSECSYGRGYVDQVVYICLTCQEKKGEFPLPAGVCCRCAEECHEDRGHHVVSIGCKGKFRCDCGSSRMPAEERCTLVEERDPENSKNIYGHNFYEKFCTCDGADDGRNHMLQCPTCWDWFHFPCIGMPKNGKVSDEWEYICARCISARYPFLSEYPNCGRALPLPAAGSAAPLVMHVPPATEGALPSLGRACRGPALGRLMPPDWKSRLHSAHLPAVESLPSSPSAPASPPAAAGPDAPESPPVAGESAASIQLGVAAADLPEFEVPRNPKRARKNDEEHE